MDKGRLIADARAFIGAPYHHQGRDERGLDCVGLIIAALRRQGIEPDAPADYGKSPPGDCLTRLIEGSGLVDEIKPGQRLPGDVLVFAIRRDPQHLGLLVERRDDGAEIMVHSAEAIRQVQAALLSESWRRRIVKVYRLK